MSLEWVKSWGYQLQNLTASGAVSALAQSSYDMLVLEPTDTVAGSESFNAAQMVTQLHASTGEAGRAKEVIAYIDVGEAENYRSYWQSGWNTQRPSWIVGTDPDGWAGNYPVAYWDPAWQAIVKQMVASAVHDGFDGAYFDWLQAYQFPGVTAAAKAAGLDPQAELDKFVAMIGSYAQSLKPGFVLIAQNAPEMGKDPAYMKWFDAIGQEDLVYTGSSTNPNSGQVPGDVPVDPATSATAQADLSVWQAAGKKVFDVEYAVQSAHASQAYAFGQSKGYVTYVGNQLLDHLSTTPPPAPAAASSAIPLVTATYADFETGSNIDLHYAPFAPASTAIAYDGQTLSVSQGSTQFVSAPVASLHLTGLSAQNFYLAPDGNGGTLVQVTQAAFLTTDVTLGNKSASSLGAAPAAGSPSYLQRQFIAQGTDSMSIAATIPNVFLHGGSGGNNALSVLSGQNVLDGGPGSNFLVGGSGPDTFFLDGRGGGVTWDTIVNGVHGDSVTIWGWQPGVTTWSWTASDGAAGYTGATLHASLSGNGAVNASITFAGVSLAAAEGFAMTTGTAGGSAYANFLL